MTHDPPLPPDPVPDHVIAAARDAFDQARAGEIAALLSDSLVDDHGTPGDHALVFDHPEMTVWVDVAYGDARTTLGGRVEPPSAEAVTVRIQGEDLGFRLPVTDGRFELSPVGHGLVRLVLSRAGGRPDIATEWFRV